MSPERVSLGAAPPSRPQPATSSSAVVPSSPCTSVSGSDCGLTSDAESTSTDATDSLSTPYTSPSPSQKPFRTSLDATSSESSLESVMSALRLQQEVAARRRSLPIGTPDADNPTAKGSLAFGGLLPSPTPFGLVPQSPRVRPPLATSLSAKRARQGQSPGLLDLSFVPRFPAQGNSSGNITPQASTNGASGLTPKATADSARPGLFSRWSTDSEGDSSRLVEEESVNLQCSSDGDGCDSDCSDCCGRTGVDAGESPGDVEKQGSSAEGPVRPPFFSRSSTSASQKSNPFLLAISGISKDILSPLPLPSSPSQVDSMLPPAPKPHQHGFSPCVELSPALSTSDPMASEGSPSPSASTTSTPSYFTIKPPGGYKHHHQQKATSPGSAGQRRKKCTKSRSRYFDNDGNDSGSDVSPATSPFVPSHSHVKPGQRLTRSQGLRIRDVGARARGSRFSKSLLTHINRDGKDKEVSSPIKTATALLDGSISPAATTTDPLRVKLREMPGAITPDITGVPSLTLSSDTASSSSSPSSPSLSPTLMTSSRNKFMRNGVWSNNSSLPSSPLHLSSFPVPPSSKEANAIFNSVFSFANTASSSGPSPSAERLDAISPRSTGPMAVAEGQNPYFAGYV